MVFATAEATDSSSWTSPTIGNACPPALSSLAAVYTAPGSWARLGGLGDQRDVGAVGGGAFGDRQPDAAARAGDGMVFPESGGGYHGCRP